MFRKEHVINFANERNHKIKLKVIVPIRILFRTQKYITLLLPQLNYNLFTMAQNDRGKSEMGDSKFETTCENSNR